MLATSRPHPLPLHQASSSPHSIASAASSDSSTASAVTPPSSLLFLDHPGKPTVASVLYTAGRSSSSSPSQSSSAIRVSPPAAPPPSPPAERPPPARAATAPQPFFSPISPVSLQFPTPDAGPGPPRSPSNASNFPPAPATASVTGVGAGRDRRQSLQAQAAPAPRGEPPRDRRQSTPLLGQYLSPGDGSTTRRKLPQAFGTKKPESKAAAGSTGGDLANELEAKVVILGAQGVGKTAMVHRITSRVFSRSVASTLGASFLTKRMVVDGCKVRLQLWDTAGQERFRSMAPLYYRGALAAILVYDITNLESFNDVKLWLLELRRDMSPDLIIHVVGCKLDLAPAHRAVDFAFAQRSVAQWEREFSISSDPSPSRDPSPPSPTRSRTRTISTRGPVTSGGGNGALPTSASMPSINTSPPSLGSRVRRMSIKLAAPPLAISATTSSSSASSSASELGVPGGNDGITRSGSRLSLSLGLGMNHARGRRSYEEERRSQDEQERARLDELVRQCTVQVTEASAAIDVGVDEVFFRVTQRLVERKSQIEKDRILRSRDSIILNDLEPAVASGSWCC